MPFSRHFFRTPCTIIWWRLTVKSRPYTKSPQVNQQKQLDERYYSIPNYTVLQSWVELVVLNTYTSRRAKKYKSKLTLYREAILKYDITVLLQVSATPTLLSTKLYFLCCRIAITQLLYFIELPRFAYCCMNLEDIDYLRQLALTPGQFFTNKMLGEK